MIDYVTMLGVASGLLGTAAHFPQVIKSLKTQETRDISLLTAIAMAVANAGWLAYGILIHNFPLILTNSISLASTCSILFLKLRYG